MRVAAVFMLLSRFATIAMLAAAPHASFGQVKSILPDIAAVRGLTNSVMSRVGAGYMEGGLRLMQPYMVIPDSEFEATVGQAKLQTPVMSQRFGKSVGAEHVREEKFGERVLKITQLQLFERHAARWSFYFYRTPRGWVLNTFNLDDNIKSYF